MPRRATTWPNPWSPSMTAVVGVSLRTRIVGVGFVVPFSIDVTYWAIRITPCESWPRRLARTSKVAIQAASSRGTPRAAKIRPVSSSRSSAFTIGILRLLGPTRVPAPGAEGNGAGAQTRAQASHLTLRERPSCRGDRPSAATRVRGATRGRSGTLAAAPVTLNRPWSVGGASARIRPRLGDHPVLLGEFERDGLLVDERARHRRLGLCGRAREHRG